MQVLRLLAARRRPRLAVSTITAAHSDEASEVEEDLGPFFDLDLFSVRASSSSSSSDDSDEAGSSELDNFIISLHRSRSAFFPRPGPAQPPPVQLFCASEPSTKAGTGMQQLLQYNTTFFPRRRCMKSNDNLRTLSFGAKMNNNNNNTFVYGGRPSFASSTRSLKLFMESDEDPSTEPTTNTKSGAVIIRRYLTSISRRLRRTVRRPPPADADAIIHRRRLRKSRSSVPPSSRRDDSLVEKHDGIASAIAHCKESFRRASLSEFDFDSSLLCSRSEMLTEASSS
ncbi:hypothetical protein QOZ80_5AG0361670 [Eleusine coracana subsp. coracana]|nr:hypothetical protein QOZ80_5AG0361670 [Eleusine coracana subsp. coracana]